MTRFVFVVLMLLGAVVAFLGGTVVRAQDSTLVLDNLGVHRDTIDTFQPQPYSLRPFIVPGTETVWVSGGRLDTSEYRLSTRAGKLWIERDEPLERSDTLVARYRTYPFAFSSVYRHRAPDSAAADTGGVAVVEEEARSDSSQFRPFEGVSIERSGSISRGVVGGTNRDANIESGLRMQLDGEVADGVRVRALLTDQNTPIQPEGTTQRLQDFDRVFLELEAPQGRARFGDVDVSLDQGRFGQFSQKVQGATLESTTIGPGPGGARGSTKVVGAVTRGQYRKQDIKPIDGVQGPYRLKGANGEQPVVVIAGSERVFLDGERLTRGRANDYVIDYARGEISFTSNRLITEERRITVEFQYSTSQFTRTLVGSETEVEAWSSQKGDPRVEVGASILRRADSRDFQTAFDLSPQDSLRLVKAGDDGAVRSGAERVQFDPEAPYVQYRRTEVTAPDGTRDTAFVALDAAPSEGTPIFRVRFSRVGQGDGRYVRGGRDVNGVVYEYRGPGRGAYEPVQPLPAPTKQRLVNITGSVEPIQGMEVFGEWARSLKDQNRFSSLDAANDRGGAYVAGVRLSSMALTPGGVEIGTLSGRLRRTHRGMHFDTFNQTRAVEYGRRWNLSRRGSGLPSVLASAGGETLDEGRLSLDLGSASRVEVGGGRLSIGSAFEAARRRARIVVGETGWPRLDLRSTYVRSTNRAEEEEGGWLRRSATIRQPLRDGRLEPRFEIEHERRRQQVLGTDSLTSGAFTSLELRPGLSYRRDEIEAKGTVEYRTEEGPAEGEFREASRSWTVQSEVSYDPSSPYRVSVNGGYRVRRVDDYFRRNENREDTESVILRVEGAANPADRAIEVRALYDAVTKRTPTLQEVYIRTGPNLGKYVWRDHNDDGVQQVDEFVPETTPNEGEYVQSFVPSDSLESVVDLQARTRVSLRPGRIWRTAEAWWKRWLAQVSTQTTVEVQEKSREEQFAQIYTLNLRRFRQPQSTLEGALTLQQDVKLFRQKRTYGIAASWRQERGLTDRAAGVETSFLNRWEVKGQLRPVSGWVTRLQGTVENDRAASEAFSGSRSFDIRTLSVQPSVSYQPTRTLTTTLSGVFARKRDRRKGRRAQVVRVPLEVEWSRVDRLRMTANAEVAQIDLTGSAVGLAQYQLTDGRGPGTSLLWGLQARYAFNESLEATLSYDGRAPSTAPPIHTVRAKLSASF